MASFYPIADFIFRCRSPVFGAEKRPPAAAIGIVVMLTFFPVFRVVEIRFPGLTIFYI